MYWSNVDDFVAGHADTAFVGIGDNQRANVVEETKALQRLLRVAPSADQVAILRQAGFTSAYAMARSPRRHFRKRFGEVAAELKDSLDGAYTVLAANENAPTGDTPIMLLSGKTPDTMADIIFNQASGKAALSLHYLVNLNMSLQPFPFGIGGSKDAQEQAKQEFFGKNPNLESLFGSLSYCECEHCRSVYSPAAYFVDLLHWLEAPDENLKGDLQSAKGPIHALLKRRPDLAHVALTCENTNTTLPYIDLINETLESFIFTHLKALPNIDPVLYEWVEGTLAGKTLEARDTGKTTAAELRAVPKYIIPEVYEHLATEAVFPMTLPFHRPLEVVRTYLGHLGTNRAEIMQVFQTGAPSSPSEEDISRERVGLSPAMTSIITFKEDVGTKDVWRYYGFDAEAGFADKVAKVPEFLARTGLSMEELVTLLKTRFVNPHIYDKPQPSEKTIITIEVDVKDPCDVSKMTLKNLTWKDNNVPDKYQWLKRIHRFLRLWRVLDWSMADLDAALHAFGSTFENDVLHDDVNTLARLDAVNWLHRELKVPVSALLAFWSDLDTWREESLYAHLFLNPYLFPQNPSDQGQALATMFTLNAAGTDLAINNKDLAQNLAPVLAVVGLTATDYEFIAALEFSDSASPPKLNLENLSLLFAYGTLARALKLRVRDVVTLIRLVPTEDRPFKKNPAATIRFVETVHKARDSGFSVPLLNYLFRDEAEPTRHPSPTRALTENTLSELQKGLAAIFQEMLVPEQPTAEDLRAALDLAMNFLGEIDATTGKLVPLSPDEALTILDPRVSQFNNQPIGLSDRTTFVTKHFTPFLSQSQQDALFDSTFASDPSETRFLENVSTVLNDLLPWLRGKLQQALVVETMADAMGTEQAVMQRLLEEVLASTDAQQPGTALQYLRSLVDEKGAPTDLLLEADPPQPPTLMVYRVFKSAALVNGFGMTDAELACFTGNASPVVPFDPSTVLNELPLDGAVPPAGLLPGKLFEVWRALQAFYALRASLPRSEKSLIDYFEAEDSDKVATLIEATGWEEGQVTALEAAGFKRDTVADLQALQRAVRLLKRVGASAAQLSSWAKAEPKHEEGEAVIQTVKSRYDQKEWLEVARSLNDPIREKQRDAMVAFLIPRIEAPEFEFKTPNDLLEYFLIDIEMSSCMLTSRIKQANSSVQMFVQRCLLNLEPEVGPDDIETEQWKWMKNYRVWEANRKVFLYPENWIEPELRDDKTPFFKDLETELLQNELIDETVEKALINYLYKLDEVARLDIRGFCKEEKEQDGGAKEIYHVFGRTWNPPYVYYYRRGIFPKNVPLGDEWTPWERVDLDIQGDHLLAVAYRRRLYVFWPIFEEKPDKQQPDKQQDAEPTTHWDIRVAWTERGSHYGDNWAPKRLSSRLSNEIKAGNFGDKGLASSFRLVLGLEAESAGIDIFSRKTKLGKNENTALDLSGQGAFVFGECRGQVIEGGKPKDAELGVPLGTTHDYQALDISGGFGLRTSTDILMSSPALLRIVPPADTLNLRDALYSFFMQDKTVLAPAKSYARQTYFARPVLETGTIPQDTQTWSESVETIKKPAQVDTKKGWAKPFSDLVNELAGMATSGG